MEKFSRRLFNIQNQETTNRIEQQRGTFVVALIDEGVDIGKLAFANHNTRGKRFYRQPRDRNCIKPHYESNGGHITMMETQI
jgi:hypothetical protein